MATSLWERWPERERLVVDWDVPVHQGTCKMKEGFLHTHTLMTAVNLWDALKITMMPATSSVSPSFTSGHATLCLSCGCPDTYGVEPYAMPDSSRILICYIGHLGTHVGSLPYIPLCGVLCLWCFMS